jgi:hypothetical protein
MKAFLLASSIALLVGCAPLPRYELRHTAFSSNPSTPLEQAKAICRPRAQLAANQARSQASAQVHAEQNQVTGYNCTTQNYGGQANTNCTPQTGSGGGGGGRLAAIGGVATGFEQAGRADRAYTDTGNTVFTACMAEQGWRSDRVCVENCR